MATARSCAARARGDVFNFSALTSRSAFKIVDGRGGGDTITGTAFSDDLRGGTNNDTIRGDDGNDRLTGGNGRDLLTGGANAVIFDFNTFGESVVGANRDQILDFSRAQADRIDLSTIDAKTGIDGNQKFTFIGTQAFHGVKGELRFKDLGANGVVQGDVNGNGTADFEIRVIVGTMLAADFLL
jgi:serralysin